MRLKAHLVAAILSLFPELAGLPTRFGMMAAQMKTFFDSTGEPTLVTLVIPSFEMSIARLALAASSRARTATAHGRAS